MPYRIEGDRVERLDVIRPRGPAPAGGWPVVLGIHGGGWRRFSKEQYAPKLAPLVRAGFAVVAPNYTLSAPGRSSWPENRDDLRDALRWIDREGPALGLDPTRVAAMGESSGAHLALLLATDPPDNQRVPRIRAVVSFSGPTDLAALEAETPGGRAAARQYLGGSSILLPEQYAEVSPIQHVTPDDPPALLVHGTKDTIVPFGQSVRLRAVLAEAGVTARLIRLGGTGHGFGMKTSGRNLLPEIVGFLKANV